jgi:hypothetical protein
MLGRGRRHVIAYHVAKSSTSRQLRGNFGVPGCELDKAKRDSCPMQ